jgi:hypothetical protein
VTRDKHLIFDPVTSKMAMPIIASITNAYGSAEAVRAGINEFGESIIDWASFHEGCFG